MYFQEIYVNVLRIASIAYDIMTLFFQSISEILLLL